MHRAWKRHQDAVFWVNIDLAIREGLTFCQTRSNAIILQGTLPAFFAFQKVERLKIGEVLYERPYLSPRPPPKISLRHDHNWTRGNDQLGSTVEQQPVGKLVQQSFGEAPRVKLSKPTQSKPKPICDRSGKLEDTERVLVDKGKTSRSHEIDDKRLLKELGSSDRSVKLEKLSEDIRVKHVHDGTGELVKSSASTHIVKEQFVPEEHRDIASFKADNEFNRAIDEENIDFNIPGVPNSTVKQSHGVQHSQLHSADRESPSATSTSKWSSTTSTIQPFQQRITRRDWSSWKHWIVRTTRCWTESTMQSMPGVLGRWHRLLHVRSLLTRWYDREQEVHQVRSWSLLFPELLHQEGPTTRSQIRKERRWSRMPHCKSTPKEVS